MASYSVIQAYYDALPEIRAATAKIARERAAALTAAGLKATADVREGAAAAQLIDAAVTDRADCIVIGSHGRTGVARVSPGSVARSVLFNAPCSVLIVRGTRVAAGEPEKVLAARARPLGLRERKENGMSVRSASEASRDSQRRDGAPQSSTGEWLREVFVPLAILSVPMILSVVSAGEWLNGAFPLAFVIGAVLRPKRLWPLWIGSILLMWAVYGYATYVAQLMPAPGEPGAGETVWSFAIESALFMAGLVLLPVWLGRRARATGRDPFLSDHIG